MLDRAIGTGIIFHIETEFQSSGSRQAFWHQRVCLDPEKIRRGGERCSNFGGVASENTDETCLPQGAGGGFKPVGSAPDLTGDM